MKKLLLLTAFFLAACLPEDGTTLGSSFATEIAPPPAHILVITAAGEKWFCNRIDEASRVAKDCIDRNKVTELTELHLGPNDTWGEIK